MKSIPSSRLARSSRRALAPAVLPVLVSAALLAACSSPDPRAIDYKSSTRQQTGPTLATPPDLIEQSRADASASQNDASLSAYQSRDRAVITREEVVLPATPGLEVKRDGAQSWLHADGRQAAKLYDEVRRFWLAEGFVLTEDSPSSAIMETDWFETRPNIDQGFIRNTLTKAVDNMYVNAQRHRYRTRLERHADGSVDIFISERGLTERISNANSDVTDWGPLPNDPGLELVYLRRLQQALAADQRAAAAGRALPSSNADLDNPTGDAASAASRDAAKERAASASASALASTPQPGNQGAVSAPSASDIDLSEDYDRAWLRVGVALERANFTVEDRDRSKGLYLIRYADPTDQGTATQGFWSQVFHGKREKKTSEYRVNVRALSAGATRVAVVQENGANDDSPAARQILGLLSDQLR